MVSNFECQTPPRRRILEITRDRYNPLPRLTPDFSTKMCTSIRFLAPGWITTWGPPNYFFLGTQNSVFGGFKIFDFDESGTRNLPQLLHVLFFIF